jgi:hypothetical protein
VAAGRRIWWAVSDGACSGNGNRRSRRDASGTTSGYSFVGRLGVVLAKRAGRDAGGTFGAGGGGRTHTALRPPDFESGASASSATPAWRLMIGSLRGIFNVGEEGVGFLSRARRGKKRTPRASAGGRLTPAPTRRCEAIAMCSFQDRSRVARRLR